MKRAYCTYPRTEESPAKPNGRHRNSAATILLSCPKVPDLVTYPEVQWFDTSVIVMLGDLSTPARMCPDHGICLRHALTCMVSAIVY